MRWTKRDWILLAALTTAAAALRLYQLGVVPPGFQFDEAFNGIDAKQVLEGNRPLFLPANAGREVLYTYWQVFVIRLLALLTSEEPAVNVYTLRLGSALGGILTVPVIFLFLRHALKRESYLVATFVALAETLNFWHIHFSHFGIRVILMPLMFTAAFGLYWKASVSSGTLRRLTFYTLSGVATGLTVWNHPTGRFAPFVLILYTGWLCRGRVQAQTSSRSARRTAFLGLLLTGVVSFLIFLPLGLVFLERPDFFFAHAADSSVMNEEVYEGSPLRTLGLNLIRVLGMFSFSGDQDWTHNLAGRPVFDAFMSVPFLAGIYCWARRIAHREDPDRNLLMLLLCWLLIMLTPSILSNDAPDFSRTMPSHPALMVAPGLGLAWIWRGAIFQTASSIWHKAGKTLVTLLVVASGGSTIYDYFIEFPTYSQLYYAYDVDKLDALNSLAPLTHTHSVYLSELWAGHATSVFLRGQYGVKSIETSNTLVLPPVGKGAVYAFPHEQAERADDLLQVFRGATLTVLNDPQGKALLYTVTVGADEATDWPTNYSPTVEQEVHFDEGPTLLGMSSQMDGSILLFWRAEQRMLRNLTSFIHLLDPHGRKIGQADKVPGNGSYGTPVWSEGERVIDRYWPTILHPCASGITARAVIGWYELDADGLRRPRADGAGEIALAGTMWMPLRSYPAEEIVPDTEVGITLSEDIVLVGYDLEIETFMPGIPFVLDLVWEGDPKDTTYSIQLIEEDTDAPGPNRESSVSLLWSGQLGYGSDWSRGKRFCRRFFLRVPPEVTPGRYQLQVSGARENGIELEALTVTASDKLFALPKNLNPQSFSFANELGERVISLVGYRVDASGDSADVMLVWRAEATMGVGYSVFVHAVDSVGQLVAQSDAMPGGVATSLWVPSEIVIDRHAFAGLPSGQIKLLVGLYDPLSGRRLTVADRESNAVPENAIELTTFVVP